MQKAETTTVRRLSKAKLGKFKKILERDKKIAMEELAKSTGEVNDLLKRCGVKTPDPADKLEPPYKENRVLGGRSQKLENIHKALHRIGAGLYGICVECSGLIEEKRLMARPTASTCVYCQSITDEEAERNKDLMCCRGTIPGKRGT